MLHNRTPIISATVSAKLVIAFLAIAVFTSSVAAQCPTMNSEGFTFGTTNFNTVKTQMWYNDGVWWGAFSDNFDGIHFYSFPNNFPVQGPIIDGNIAGNPDALWDGTNLFVAVWKSVSLATLYKYTYNSVSKTHTLVSGFPVNLALNGSSTAAIVLEKDTTGKLWATYTGTQGGLSDGKIRVIWSTSADHTTWNTTGFELESGLAANIIEISAITHFGGDKIGIAWSNQVAKQIAFRYHVDGTPETTWSTKEIIDSGLGPRGLGGVADDHLSMKAAPDGRIFLAAKDNDNDGTPLHATEGRVWLYVRTVAGTWGQKTIVQPDFSQLPTRPILLLDISNNQAYVVYHDDSPSGAGRNFIAHTDMDNLSFDFPCVFNMTSSSNPTSTKQNVSASTGIMVAASTGATGSNELVFRSVLLPQPAVVTTISPTSGATGAGAFQLTVNGTGFVDGQFVQWNGSDRLTTFVNSTQLVADVLPEDVSVAGTYQVTVFNPSTGTVSNSVPFAVNNPVPTISGISPTSKTTGSPAFDLTVNGLNFVAGSVVLFNGNARPTTFLSNTQLMAQINAADIQTAGSFPITVFNPAPGGGTSGAAQLVVNNAPLPIVNNLNPSSKTAGDASFTLTVNGSNFVNGSIVRLAGLDKTTAFVNANQLTAQINAADVQTAGDFPVTVFNPGTGTSNVVNLTVNNPLPSPSSISPTTKNVGDPAFTLTVNGSNFVNGSVVRFNDSNRTTSFVGSTQLTAQITAADVQAAGSFPITVFNPAPGGGTSNAINLTVNSQSNPAPVLTSSSPTSKQAASGAFTLTVNGSSFIASSEVRWNGQARVTTFVNSGQLTAQIEAADIAAPGTAAVTVFNPPPGGGLSSSLNFTIDAAGCAGFESDVAPRPNGNNNGFITVSDWVQTGRFSAGLDTPNAGCEFQRADSAPRNSLGNGVITVSDWVQAGRYAAGLDPVTPIGGPTGPPSAPQQLGPGTSAITPKADADRILRVVGASLTPGQSASISIELDSQGNENALGFSITFDPSKLSYVSTVLGSGANGTVMNSNSAQAGSGRVGVAISQQAGSSFSQGTRQLVVMTFNVAAGASGSTVIGFGDVPILREIVDVSALELPGTYNSASLNIVGSSNPVLQFSAQSFNASEGAGSAVITVSRSGDPTSTVSVDYGIDGPVGYAPCLVSNGVAAQNCDYTIIAGTLRFASGETSKSFTIPLIDDVHDEMDETLGLKLINVVGATLGSAGTTSLLILDNDSGPPSSNPIDEAGFFVRQHYLDFLNREPDAGGLDYWSFQINECGTNEACIRARRIGVSGAFFVELEFQQTGSVIYRLYKAAYGQRPSYPQFMPDRSQLVAGPQLLASTQSFVTRFVLRPGFKAAYPDQLSNSDFVNKLFDTAELMNNPTQRQQAIDALNANTKSRAEVLLDLIETAEFKDREYNPSFVLMQYFGYLRRDPDQAGYDFWLNVLNNQEPNNYRGMICSFLTSGEYQHRFSSVVTRSNSQCGQ